MPNRCPTIHRFTWELSNYVPRHLHSPDFHAAQTARLPNSAGPAPDKRQTPGTRHWPIASTRLVPPEVCHCPRDNPRWKLLPCYLIDLLLSMNRLAFRSISTPNPQFPPPPSTHERSNNNQEPSIPSPLPTPSCCGARKGLITVDHDRLPQISDTLALATSLYVGWWASGQVGMWTTLVTLRECARARPRL